MYVYVGGVFSLFEFSSRFVGIISILCQRFNVKPHFNFFQRFYRDVRFEIIDVIFFFLWKLKFIFGGDVINYFLELMIFVDILFVLGRDTIYKYLLTLLHDTNICPRWNYRCIFINSYFSSLCKFVIFPREKFNIPNTSTSRIISYSSRG